MKRDTVEKSLIDISSAFEVSKTSFLFWYVHSSVEKQQHNKSRHRTMRYQTWTSQMAIKISLYPERSCRCCCCITNVFITKFYLWFPLVTIIIASLTKEASHGDTSKMMTKGMIIKMTKHKLKDHTRTPWRHISQQQQNFQWE